MNIILKTMSRYYIMFPNWNKRERREFWISLLLTIIFCALMYFVMIIGYGD